MTAAPIHFRDERLMLDPAGAAFWPARRILIVADLHLEKASSAALRGNLLPPFDTRATLEKLNRVIRLYRPAKVIALGDTFHDRTGSERLAETDRARLAAMAREAHFIWILGNHDPHPSDLPGEHAAEWREAGVTFRHEAAAALAPREIEISGHFHPKASIDTKAKRVSRPLLRGRCLPADAAGLRRLYRRAGRPRPGDRQIFPARPAGIFARARTSYSPSPSASWAAWPRWHDGGAIGQTANARKQSSGPVALSPARSKGIKVFFCFFFVHKKEESAALT